MNRTVTSAVLIGGLCMMACGRVRVEVPDTPPPPATLAELWVEPDEARDLYWGIGGKMHAPAPDAVYKLEARDDAGFSVSYDVVDPEGTEWSAKIGPEAQTEVVVSRILWGLGYHQPPLYYLPSWKIDGQGDAARRESEARFRPKLKQLDRQKEYWRWADNPLLGAREFRGLLVTLLMLNSTDLKDDNNSIYTLQTPWDGASRWLVVRDVGAALGRTGKLFPHRNWVEGFEQEPFITAVSGTKVRFAYAGRHQELLDMITPDDIRWAAARMRRLSDAQWRDAFRAGNYADPIADRFIRRIREKIDDGLALRVDARAREDE